MDAIVGGRARGGMSNGYSIDRRRATQCGAVAGCCKVDHTARMRWPLAGREAELRSVAAALSEGSVGGVVIVGPAGTASADAASTPTKSAATMPPMVPASSSYPHTRTASRPSSRRSRHSAPAMIGPALTGVAPADTLRQRMGNSGQ
jgi:hypothetical protein